MRPAVEPAPRAAGSRTPARAQRAGGREAGISLIEVVVGFGILLVVLIGLLPLFTRAILDNVQGKELTLGANHGRTEIEDLSELAFNNWQFEIQGGSVRTSDSYLALGDPGIFGDEVWLPTASPSETVPWQRTTTIRQFGINRAIDSDLDGVVDLLVGLEDSNLDGLFDSPLAAGTARQSIHLKQLDLVVQSLRETAASGPATEITMQAMKAF